MFKKLLLSCGLILALVPGLSNACDVTLIGVPTYISPQSITIVQTGVYTLRNNTPSTIGLPLTQIITLPGDTLPAGDTFIDPTVFNACGFFIAPFSTCNIRVVIAPTVVGVIRRLLSIAVNSRQCNLTSPISLTTFDPR